MPEYRNIPLDAPCYSSVAEPGGRVFCVTVDELIECGLSENYLYKGLSRQRSEELSCWSHHKEGRVVYIHYDGLKPNYQALIRAKLMQDMQPEDWFNQHGRADWIMKRLQPYAALNPVDETYLDVATYPNGEKLTPEARAIASESCRWLGMFVRLKRKQDIKAIGYTSVTEFYDDATFMFAKKGIQLPTSYVKLRRKIVEYERVGASCCVDLRGQSNKNAAKVYNEEQTALLRSLCGRGASYNCQQVADLYNTVAKEKGWEEISRRSALNYLREYHLVVKAGRDGSEAFRNKISMQRRRKRPSEALSFWSLDGWTAELYYQKDIVGADGKVTHTYTNRLTAVVVLDACNDYPVGLAIGEKENVKLITAAVKNAIDYVHDTLGDLYRPYQIQSDHFGIKSMSTIYEDVAEYFTPARVKNAKAKPVERYFLGLNRNYCQYYFGNYNWSGFGITSRKENQPNIDVLNNNKRRFPDKEGVIEQITWIINEERRKKHDAWLKFWEKMPETDRLKMSRETYLLNFGQRTDRSIRLQAGCLEPVLLGEKRSYDSFDLNFRKDPLQSWNVYYDERDLSTILVTDETKKERHLLEEVYKQPMALRDRKPGDAEAHRRVDEFNKRVLEPYVINTITSDEEKVMSLIRQTPEIEGKRAATMLTDSRGQQKSYLQHASLIKSDEDLLAEMDDICDQAEKRLFKQMHKQRLNEEKKTQKQAEMAYEEYARKKIDIDKFKNV